MFCPSSPMIASPLMMEAPRPVPGTPVGRITVTLIRPCDSVRSDSDSTFTAAFVAP